MKPFALRAILLLLAPCLLIDPALAGGFESLHTSVPSPASMEIGSGSLFQEQTVTPYLLSSALPRLMIHVRRFKNAGFQAWAAANAGPIRGENRLNDLLYFAKNGILYAYIRATLQYVMQDVDAGINFIYQLAHRGPIWPTSKIPSELAHLANRNVTLSEAMQAIEFTANVQDGASVNVTRELDNFTSEHTQINIRSSGRWNWRRLLGWVDASEGMSMVRDFFEPMFMGHLFGTNYRVNIVGRGVGGLVITITVFPPINFSDLFIFDRNSSPMRATVRTGWMGGTPQLLEDVRYGYLQYLLSPLLIFPFEQLRLWNMVRQWIRTRRGPTWAPTHPNPRLEPIVPSEQGLTLQELMNVLAEEIQIQNGVSVTALGNSVEPTRNLDINLYQTDPHQSLFRRLGSMLRRLVGWTAVDTGLLNIQSFFDKYDAPIYRYKITAKERSLGGWIIHVTQVFDNEEMGKVMKSMTKARSILPIGKPSVIESGHMSEDRFRIHRVDTGILQPKNPLSPRNPLNSAA